MGSNVEQETVAQIAPVEGSGLSGNSASTTVATIDEDAGGNGSIAAFASQTKFLAAQRIAKALASSSLVPKQYQGQNGVANCLVAMELASRTGASVLMVMQNLHVIQGRPSWAATFLIGSINSCGRFSPLRYEFAGTEAKAGWKCRAYAFDLKTSERLDGEWITWEMVNAEGWLSKSGSKWKTMPGQMIRYRAASFWARTYAPEISLGMHTAEEAADIGDHHQRSNGAQDLNAALRVAPAEEITATITDAPSSIDERAPLDESAEKPKKCPICFRRDGTHDPAASCFADDD